MNTEFNKKNLLSVIGYPHLLVAICSETKKIIPQLIKNELQKGKFIERYNTNQKFNIYWLINDNDASLKRTKKDIKAVRFLFCDIDPKDRTKDHIRAFLENDFPSEIPKPSLILDSGNGYQLFWRLDSPQYIQANKEKAERCSKWISSKLGGDNCHNIDRLARLPDTKNYPDATKRKRGYKISHSSIYTCNLDITYPLDEFEEEDIKSSSLEISDIKLPEKKVNIKDLNLPEVLISQITTESLKKTSLDGKALKEETYPSRSEKLLSVCMSLLYLKISDEKILSILLNESYFLIDHIKDHAPNNMKAYAIRQINRARLKLEDLNKKDESDEKKALESLKDYFMLQAPTQTMICHKLIKGKLRLLNKESFLMDTAHLKLSEKKADNLGKVWLSSSKKKVYSDIMIKSNPTKEEEKRCFNLWNGLSIESQNGSCENIKSFLKTIICSNNQKKYDYLIKLISWKIKNPTEAPRVAIFLTGGQGVGKGMFARNILGEIFKDYFIHYQTADHILGRFNDDLIGKVYCFMDEGCFTATKESDRLKAFITEDTFMIEPKGKSRFPIRNSMFFIFASNREHTIRIEPDDRRFLVLEVSDEQKNKKEYFRPLIENIKKELACFVHELKNTDLNDFSPSGDLISTSEKEDQKKLSLNTFEQVIQSWLEDGQIHLKTDDGSVLNSSNIEIPEYESDQFIKVLKKNHRDISLGRNKILAILKKLGCKKGKRKNLNTIIFPPLQEMRNMWDKVKIKTNWSDPKKNQEWTIPDPSLPH